MHLELLVEEASAEAALQHLIPKIVPGVTFVIHPHQGKADLLAKLADRLRGYRTWLTEEYRIGVLIDEDRHSAGCLDLKQRLEEAAQAARLRTRATATTPAEVQVVNRIAVEELEAWFFGDVPAIVAAYDRVPITLDRRQPYRDPDAIKGGTWERLERVLQDAGHYRGGLPKVEVARKIAEHMEPARNRSRSFRAFRDGLRRLILPPPE
jgi:hypothetical protein